MKIAIVHDQISEFGGAERVLLALKKIFPQAEVFTSFYSPFSLGQHAPQFKKWQIKTSWFGKVPLLHKLYSPLRFLTPLIWESFDFRGYDIVISSSGSLMCKGIITRPETLHICYLHHPPRYLYHYETAIEWQKYWLVKIYGHLINHKIRQWDYFSSARVDHFIANSEETKRRITKFYHRDATVIYPPVSILPQLITDNLRPATYFVTTSRLARAKHIEVLIKAANKYRFHLKIVGQGRDETYLRSLAGKTVQFMGNLPDHDFTKLYQNAKAFLFAAVDEEFGIAPIEAMGYGLPVIALNSGGLKETIQDGINGYLYDQLNEDSLFTKIKQWENLSINDKKKMRLEARQSAEKYTFNIFKNNILNYVKSKINF